MPAAVVMRWIVLGYLAVQELIKEGRTGMGHRIGELGSRIHEGNAQL